MKKILTLVIPILFLSSCVVYYKTDDVRKTIVSNVNIAKENQSSTNKDYIDKLDTYKWLEASIVNKDLEPFKSITKYKNKMFKTYEAIGVKTDEIKALQLTFDALAKGKKEIKSNEDTWKEFKTIKSNMKSISAEIDELNLKYVAASNALGNTISNSHFKTLNNNELKTNIENNLSEIRASAKSTSIKITRYRRELNNAKNKIADSTYKQKSEILNQMDKMLSETENSQTNIESALAEVLKKTPFLRTRDEIWTGENTKSQIQVKKIQDGISQIKQAQAMFNKLAASINVISSE
jgi:uncharacterized protein YdcH (DUF465 family)